jgi:hypothetical protein
MPLTYLPPTHSCRYGDGTEGTFDSCANPDGDPLGHWCQVDPAQCDNYATVVKKGQVRAVRVKGVEGPCSRPLSVNSGSSWGPVDVCMAAALLPSSHTRDIRPDTIAAPGLATLQMVSIGYCASRFKQPEPTTCVAKLGLGDQCGGKSNCSSSLGCVNAPWPGACCPSGSECRRRDAVFQVGALAGASAASKCSV